MDHQEKERRWNTLETLSEREIELLGYQNIASLNASLLMTLICQRAPTSRLTLRSVEEVKCIRRN